MASPDHPSPTKTIGIAATEPPRGAQARLILRTNTQWPPEKGAPTKRNLLSRIIKALLPKKDHKPKLDIGAVRSQIICTLLHALHHLKWLTPVPANALAIATMACVHADYAGEVLKVDDPKLFIVTLNEGDQIQAAVVYYEYQPEQHSKIRTVFQGSLAGSDTQALLSLYEESKRVATNWKANLESRGLWAVG